MERGKYDWFGRQSRSGPTVLLNTIVNLFSTSDMVFTCFTSALAEQLPHSERSGL